LIKEQERSSNTDAELFNLQREREELISRLQYLENEMDDRIKSVRKAADSVKKNLNLVRFQYFSLDKE
jgi:hypothetical protein